MEKVTINEAIASKNNFLKDAWVTDSDNHNLGSAREGDDPKASMLVIGNAKRSIVPKKKREEHLNIVLLSQLVQKKVTGKTHNIARKKATGDKNIHESDGSDITP